MTTEQHEPKRSNFTARNPKRASGTGKRVSNDTPLVMLVIGEDERKTLEAQYRSMNIHELDDLCEQFHDPEAQGRDLDVMNLILQAMHEKKTKQAGQSR